eukprot:TRINITY_DN37081_c0_g1_i1.p1 TRINITY_DN37081_c0_g1~~TRINITY_DN37081_c0_g1_i1.p1  ORF type:complete len:384 (+),score=52.05 TRINITY_DN37081_c0_g1_i1:358-1509(+)
MAAAAAPSAAAAAASIPTPAPPAGPPGLPSSGSPRTAAAAEAAHTRRPADVQQESPFLNGRYVHDLPCPCYSMAWCPMPASKMRLAVGSCLEQDPNKLQILEFNEETKRLDATAEIEHNYPPTKLMWAPQDSLIATTSTTLNIYKVKDNQIKPRATLAHTRRRQRLPPLTSFDWSSVNHDKIGASSVDTTCTIWNLEKSKIETQFIAHDKAVYDIAFRGDDLLASVGADGSVRMFDQRNLDHSVIIYEASPPAPLLRVAWNKLNFNLIATTSLDGDGVILVDVRRASVAHAALSYNETCVNDFAWSPNSSRHLLCGTDDGCSLIWDVKDAPPKPYPRDGSAKPKLSPYLAFQSEHEVYKVMWPSAQPDHVVLGMGRRIEMLQI